MDGLLIFLIKFMNLFEHNIVTNMIPEFEKTGGNDYKK
jgi:hypothetical protein